MQESEVAAIRSLYLVLLASPAFGCSVPLCMGDGIEIDPRATIQVVHQGSRLSGVSVRITRSGPDDKAVFTGETGVNGTLVLPRLIPGVYWLNAEYLGISAALHCFHVRPQPSPGAKRKLKYKWGEWPTSTLRIAGELIDLQPGAGVGATLNRDYRIAVPIVGAELVLQNPRTGSVMRTDSAEDGTFAFGDAQEGVYVLRISGGSTGRSYEPTSMLIKRARTALFDRLRLERADDCGAPSLRLVRPPR